MEVYKLLQYPPKWRPSAGALPSQTDSRPLYGGELGGRNGNLVDGSARRGTGHGRKHHRAKVRVAGSNRVFPSSCNCA
jgi:hypothetical protein